jgi:hypothetical protein
MTADELAVVVGAAAAQELDSALLRIKHCLGQLNDELVWRCSQRSLNSIGNLILHLCGNLRQWIVAGVGGSSDVRNRPAEFAERGPIPKEELLRRLEAAVKDAKGILEGVDARQLAEVRRIQGFDVTGAAAIFSSVPHFRGHTQEIVHMTRLQLGDAYKFAWAPATPEQGATPSQVETETESTKELKEMPAQPINEREEKVLEFLDRLLQQKPVSVLLDAAVARVEQRLRADPEAAMAWEPIPLDVYGTPLPGSIQSGWVFILRADRATGAERHPNSRQRMMSYRGSGDLQTRAGERWVANLLGSAPSLPLERRWISIPENVWHQAVTPEENWVVVSFHTVPADELMEERPDASDAGSTRQRRYSDMT